MAKNRKSKPRFNSPNALITRSGRPYSVSSNPSESEAEAEIVAEAAPPPAYKLPDSLALMIDDISSGSIPALATPITGQTPLTPMLASAPSQWPELGPVDGVAVPGAVVLAGTISSAADNGRISGGTPPACRNATKEAAPPRTWSSLFSTLPQAAGTSLTKSVHQPCARLQFPQFSSSCSRISLGFTSPFKCSSPILISAVSGDSAEGKIPD